LGRIVKEGTKWIGLCFGLAVMSRALASDNLEKSLVVAARSFLLKLERVLASTETTAVSVRSENKDETVIRASLSGQPPLELSGPSGVVEAPPPLEALPLVDSQAVLSQSPRGNQPDPQVPPPPAAPPSSNPSPPATAAQPPSNPSQPAARRDQRAPARPAPADVEQQIQFDRAGLVTMHVNELDVRQLLELLSRRSGLNILVSPRVSGVITANFESATLDTVLKSVIKLANLVEKSEGSIHYLYTKGEMDDDAEIAKRDRILTRVYKLNYVRSDEMLAMIRPFLSADVGQKRVSVTPSYRFGIGESATFVSGGAGAASAGGGGGGTANTGGPTNQGASGGGSTVGGYQPPTGGNSMSDSDLLVVQDYESNLKLVDQIVQRIDRRPIQVLIEAVIISVDLERARQLGVNFSLVDNLGTVLGTVGSGASLNNNVGFNPTQLLTTAGKIAGATTDPTGFASATNGAKFGFVANNVTGFIQALETIGSTKILASPRILVLNKQRAEIQLGTRLGFQTFSQNFTSTIQQVQFLNTGTLLRIRPFISEDGMIRMEIHPERSSGTVVNNIPNQQTAELTTNVMVPDGATLIIGGLMEDEDDYSIQGMPGLARIPALGYLFGFRQKNEGRRELVVLLTPHIWSGDQTAQPLPNMGVPIPDCRTVDSTGNVAADLVSADTTFADSRSLGPMLLTVPPKIALTSNTVVPQVALLPLARPAVTPTSSRPQPPVATTANNDPQNPRSPRRRVFGSLVDKMTGRTETQNRGPALPAAAPPGGGAPTDPNNGNRPVIPFPNPMIAPGLSRNAGTPPQSSQTGGTQ
jgi:general secretion pathway protein D